MNNPLVVLTFVLLKNYLTFTLHFRVIPFAFTVIVALPFFLATTLPLAFTVATLVLDDLNVTLPVGIIRFGVQIRNAKKDDNYPNGTHGFDVSGLRFVTSLSENILSQLDNLSLLNLNMVTLLQKKALQKIMLKAIIISWNITVQMLMARTQLKSIIMYKTKIVQVRLVDMVVKSLLITLIISQKHTVFILL